jgi:glycerol-3-phosphate O-acyltransferase / dihydroxyacetone phosphate acyltransferase
MSSRANWITRSTARLSAWLFYRIDRIGDVPQTGPVLLLPNHPNSLLDPALVWATAGRDVRFLAKSTLFDGPLRPVLNGAGAIPVYRRIDEGVDLSRNAETFAAVSAALAQGDAVCLFPEGITHSSGRLETLRTGAARMALSAEGAGTHVSLIPVGINLDRKAAFRSRVTVAFGKPFSAADLLPRLESDFHGAVRELTNRIAAHIRSLLVEADPQRDAAMVDRIERLYATARTLPDSPEQRLARRRAIAAGIEKVRSGAPERYEQFLLRVRRYDDRLQRFGLRDSHLDWQVTSRSALRFAARELLFAIVLIPLCVAGLVVFFVPYWVTGWVAKQTASERAMLATAQLIGGTVVYGLWLALFVVAAWRLAGSGAAIAAALSIPLLAVASLFAIERESAVFDAVRAWWLMRQRSDETRERLRRKRSELADVLDEIRQWLSETAAVQSSR